MAGAVADEGADGYEERIGWRNSLPVLGRVLARILISTRLFAPLQGEGGEGWIPKAPGFQSKNEDCLRNGLGRIRASMSIVRFLAYLA